MLTGATGAHFLVFDQAAYGYGHTRVYYGVFTVMLRCITDFYGVSPMPTRRALHVEP